MSKNVVQGKAAFVERLRRWRDETDLHTLRDRARKEGIGKLTVVVGEVEVGLVGDTKRKRIEEFLDWVDENGTDAPWDVLPTSPASSRTSASVVPARPAGTSTSASPGTRPAPSETAASLSQAAQRSSSPSVWLSASAKSGTSSSGTVKCVIQPASYTA